MNDMEINFCMWLGGQSFHLNESIYIFSNTLTFPSFSLTILFDSSTRFFLHFAHFILALCVVLTSCLLECIYFESPYVIFSIRTAGISKATFTQISCETKQFVAYGPFVIVSNFSAHISAYKYCKYYENSSHDCFYVQNLY